MHGTMRPSLACALAIVLLWVSSGLCLAEKPELYECVVGHAPPSPLRTARAPAKPSVAPAAKVQQAVTAMRSAGVKVRDAMI
jgi:hypothetical protein